MRGLLQTLIIPVLTVGLLAGAGAIAQAEQPVLVDDLHLPFTQWARPLPGGSVRTFCGIGQPNQQVLWSSMDEVIDLDARFYNPHTYGYAGNVRPELNAARDRALEQRYQLYIFGGGVFGELSAEQRAAILRNVRDGAGLVFLGKVADAPSELQELVEQAADASEPLVSYVSRAVPAAALEMELPFTARGVGNGRVVWMEWGDFSPYALPEKNWQDHDPPMPFDAAEDYAMAASARVMRWAAGRAADVVIAASVPDDTTAAGQAIVRLALNRPNAADTVRYRVRNSEGAVLAEWENRAARGAEVKLPQLPAGTYLVDAFAMREGSVVEWTTTPLSVDSTLRIEDITTKPSYGPLEPITGNVRLGYGKQEPPRCRLVVQLLDTYDRVIAVREISVDAGASAAPFFFDGVRPVGAKHTIRAELYAGGVHHHTVSEWCTVVDEDDADDTFHVFTLLGRSRAINAHYQRYLRMKGMTAVNGDFGWDNALDAGMRVFTGLHTIRNDPQRLRSVIPQMLRYSPIGHLYSDEAALPPDEMAQMKSLISTLDRGRRGGLSGVAVYAPWFLHSMDAPSFISNQDFFLCYAPPQIFSQNFWQSAGRDVIRSFISDDAIWGPWTGYAAWTDHEPWCRAQAWSTLFDGGNLLAFFMQFAGGKFVHQLPDGTLTQEAMWMMEEASRLQKGIAQQVRAVPREPAQIAVLWPHERTKEAYGWPDGLNALCFALNDLGHQYEFISEEEAARPGGLQENGYDVLILSGCVQQPDIPARVLSGFVSNGGLLIADTRLAIQDADGEFVDTSSWDGLFGIKRHSPPAERAQAEESNFLHSEIPIEVATTGDGVLPDLAGWRHGCITGEPGVEVAAGTALARYARVAGQGEGTSWVEDFVGAPAFIVRQRGSGATVYLNCRLQSEMLTGRDAESEKAKRHRRHRVANAQLMASLLTLADVTNVNGVVTTPGGDRLPYTKVHPFRQAGMRLYGLMQETYINRPDRRQLDKETARYYLHGHASFDPKAAIVRFPESGHIYDVREQKYLGRADRIEATMTAGRGELYAVLDYRVTGVTVEGADDQNTHEPGEVFTYGARLQADGGPAGPHAFAVEWLAPDGSLIEHYRDVIVGPGAAAGRMQFALNDPTGEWTLRVTDVISGARAEQTVRLKKGGLDKEMVTAPPRPKLTISQEPFAFDPLKGGMNPGNGYALNRVTHNPQPAPLQPKPKLKLSEPSIQRKHWRTWFPGHGWYKINQVWQADFRGSDLPGGYSVRWVGTGRAEPEVSNKPVVDSALGLEAPANENWLGWAKGGFLHVLLDDVDLRTVTAVPQQTEEGSLRITWDAEAATVTLQIAAVEGQGCLLCRLDIRAKQAITQPVIKLHNRAGGVNSVGDFWYAATARRDNALGATLRLPAENWVVFADRAMNQAHNKGAGVSALLVAPDPDAVREVRLARRGDDQEPTNRFQGMDSRERVKAVWHHMMEAAITLAPVDAGQTRSLRFALWEWPNTANGEARRKLERRRDEVTTLLRNDEW